MSDDGFLPPSRKDITELAWMVGALVVSMIVGSLAAVVL